MVASHKLNPAFMQLMTQQAMLQAWAAWAGSPAALAACTWARTTPSSLAASQGVAWAVGRLFTRSIACAHQHIMHGGGH